MLHTVCLTLPSTALSSICDLNGSSSWPFAQSLRATNEAHLTVTHVSSTSSCLLPCFICFQQLIKSGISIPRLVSPSYKSSNSEAFSQVQSVGVRLMITRDCQRPICSCGLNQAWDLVCYSVAKTALEDILGRTRET